MNADRCSDVAKDRGLTFDFTNPIAISWPPSRIPTGSRRSRSESVDGDTLDSLRGARQIRDIDFVKADTQGSELLVLQGARQSHIVASAIGVEVEAEFTPIYKTAAGLCRCRRLSAAARFAPVRSPAVLLEARCRAGPRRPAWTNHLDRRPVPQEPAGPARHHRRIRGGRSKRKSAEGRVDRPVVRLLDYALEIARALAPVLRPRMKRRVIDQRLLASVESSGPLAAIPGSRRIAASLVRLAKWIRPRSRGWSVSNAGSREPSLTVSSGGPASVGSVAGSLLTSTSSPAISTPAGAGSAIWTGARWSARRRMSCSARISPGWKNPVANSAMP